MKKLLIAILCLGLAAGLFVSKVVGQEVNNVPPIVELTAISTNFSYTESSQIYGDGGGAKIRGIIFYPSTGDTGDVLVIRHGSSSGPKICILRTIDYTDARYVDCGGAKLKPYIVWTECSMSTGHTLTFILE